MKKIAVSVIVALALSGCVSLAEFCGDAGNMIAGQSGQTFGASLAGPTAEQEYWKKQNREASLRYESPSFLTTVAETNQQKITRR